MHNNVNKIPDRLNISNKASEIVDNIDNTNILSLGRNSSNRITLFIFAMARGLRTLAIPLASTKQGGFILETAIDHESKALIYACYIGSLSNINHLDSILDKEKIFSLAQEYANTGFENIDSDMKEYKESSIPYHLIEQLDDMYEEYLGSE